MVSVVLQATNELFLHVPKVAGGSISRSLLSRSDALRYAVTNMETAIPRVEQLQRCLLYTSPSPRDATLSRMPSSA